jgi:hypothetical protein
LGVLDGQLRSTGEENPMTPSPTDAGYMNFRLALIDPRFNRIHVIQTPGGVLLPRESIPTHVWVAEALTEVVERVYGVQTVQLANLPGSANRPLLTRQLPVCSDSQIEADNVG